MAKPNYGFEKRQRELAKKKKQDEKNAKKLAARGTPSPADTTHDVEVAEPAPPAAPAAPAPAGPRIHRRTTGERTGG